MIRNLIVDTAKGYIGQKEIKGNMGFLNDYFEKKIQGVGWQEGQAWCSYFVELVWCEAYGKINSSYITELQKLFSANAVRTYNRLAANGYNGSVNPTPGDIVLWQSYKKNEPKKNGEWFLGHIGIVSEVHKDYFKSIEGNTNSLGGREGIEVAEKKRTYNWNSNNGLRLIGFIQPKHIKS